MFSLFSLPITVSGVPVANGSIALTLIGGPATIISTGAAAPNSYIFNLDGSGNPPAIMQAWGNAELSPSGTQYTYAVWSGANATGSVVIGPFTSIVGPSAPFAGTLYPNLTVLPLLSLGSINGVNVTGTPSSGQVLTATSGTAATWQSSSLSGSFSDIVTVTGSASLPAATGSNVRWAGGFSSPIAGRFFFSDGTGWKMMFSKRTSSVTTDLFTFEDNGNLTAAGRVFTSTSNANVTPVTVTGTTTQTALQVLTLGTGELNAVGRWMTVKAHGVLSAGATPGSWTLTLKLGATTLASTTVNPGASTTNIPWWFEADVMCQTAGATGAVEVHGTEILTGITSFAFTNTGNPVGGIDLTSALSLTLFCTNTQTATSCTSRVMGFQRNN